MYYYNENGEVMSYQPPQPQPQPQPRPVYYYQPQTPVYYQPAQQVSTNRSYDDSGHGDGSVQNYSYPVYYTQPPPIYYPPTPATATPHIMTTPVFPVVVNNPQYQTATAQAPVTTQTEDVQNENDQTENADASEENEEQQDTELAEETQEEEPSNEQTEPESTQAATQTAEN